MLIGAMTTVDIAIQDYVDELEKAKTLALKDDKDRLLVPIIEDRIRKAKVMCNQICSDCINLQYESEE